MSFFKYIAFFFLFLSLGSAFAQLDPIFTHHSYVRMTVNPAYSGYKDDLTIKFLHRSQWVGFEDAPSTQLLAFHMPILEEKAGVGFSVINDRFNPSRSTSFFGDGSYKIPLSNDRGVLSFGLKAGFNLTSTSLTELKTVQDADPSYSQDVKTRFLPNFGFGFLYKTDKFYLGVSSPRLIQNRYIKGSSDAFSLREKVHFYGITGSMHTISKNVELGQTLSMRLTSGIPVQFQASGLMRIKDKYQVSFMLRTGDAVGLMLGYHVTKQIWVSYSYDWSFNNRTFLYNSGSHEIMIKYALSRAFNTRGSSRY